MKKTKKTTSSKPMTMLALLQLLAEDGIENEKIFPMPSVRLTVQGKDRMLGSSRFYVYVRDAGDSAFLNMNLTVSVPKHRVGEALNLLRRLHEMR